MTDTTHTHSSGLQAACLEQTLKKLRPCVHVWVQPEGRTKYDGAVAGAGGDTRSHMIHALDEMNVEGDSLDCSAVGRTVATGTRGDL